MFDKIPFRYINKIMRGEDPIKIRYSKEAWDEQFRKGKWDFLLNTQPNIVMVTKMLEDISVREGNISILDVGCGNGALARELSSNSFSYTGTDISSTALEKARLVAPHGTFFQSNMDDQPVIEGKFDVIIFCEVLLYGDYDKILDAYKPYLKDGGYIIVSLYDVWRTKIIWLKVKKQINFFNSVYIKHLERNIGWTVRVGKLSKN